MGTNYPTGLDTATELPSRADGDATATVHAADHTNLAAAVIAIEAELGIAPSGSEATVKDVLTALMSSFARESDVYMAMDMALEAQKEAIDLDAIMERKVEFELDQKADLYHQHPDNGIPIDWQHKSMRGTAQFGNIDFDTDFSAGDTLAFVDGSMYWFPVWVPRDVTINGMKFCVAVNGVFTADNNNKIAIATSDGTTLTLVGSSANDAALFTGGAGWRGKDLSAPVFVAGGQFLYYGFLRNSTAAGTAPSTYCGSGSLGVLATSSSPFVPTPNHASMLFAAQTDVASTYTIASGTSIGKQPAVSFY